MGNAISWFELVGPEPEKTAAFFGELFGWHTEATEGGGYFLIDTHSGRGMNGAVLAPPPKGRPGSILYVQGPDVQAMLDRAESLGGKTRMPVTQMAMVTFAVFTDPWGNRIGLMEGDGDAPVSAGDNASVDWVEIGCAEPEEAFAFYRDLFGWTTETDMAGEGGGPVHASFSTGANGGARGGIGSSRDDEPHVDIYANVDDVGAYLERAAVLGGTIVMPAMKVDEQTEIGMFADPQGGTFGLYS